MTLFDNCAEINIIVDWDSGSGRPPGRALQSFAKNVSPDECGRTFKLVENTNFLSIAWFPKKNYHDVLYKYPFRLNAASFFSHQ